MDLTQELILAESALGRVPPHLANMFTFHRGALRRIEELELALVIEAQRSCGLEPFNFANAAGHVRVIANSPDRNELSVLNSFISAIENHPDFKDAVEACEPALARVTELRQAVAQAEHERILRIDALAAAERAALDAARRRVEKDPAVIKARQDLDRFTADAEPEPITLTRGRVKLPADSEMELAAS